MTVEAQAAVTVQVAAPVQAQTTTTSDATDQTVTAATAATPVDPTAQAAPVVTPRRPKTTEQAVLVAQATILAAAASRRRL